VKARLADAVSGVGAAGHGEEQIRKPIEVNDRQVVDRLDRRKRDAGTLSTTRNRTGMMKRGAGCVPSRKDELLQRFELGIETVNKILEALNIVIVHRMQGAAHRSIERGGEVSTYVEEIALKVTQDAVKVSIDPLRTNQAEGGVGLIDRTVRFNPNSIL
jgi:hydroxypyruvate isomerase